MRNDKKRAAFIIEFYVVSFLLTAEFVLEKKCKASLQAVWLEPVAGNAESRNICDIRHILAKDGHVC